MGGDETLTVTITLRDVYFAVQDVQRTIAPLPGYVSQIADHEARMRSLERWRYSIPAALLVTAGNVLITAGELAYAFMSSKGK